MNIKFPRILFLSILLLAGGMFFSFQNARGAASDLLTIGVERTQKDWNTFAFRADTNRRDGVRIEWSFGDGASAEGNVVDHSYRFAGQYIVSAVATSATGERAQQKMTLPISFWHLSNWQLALMLVILVALAILFLSVTRPEDESGRYAFTEGDPDDNAMPPVLRAAHAIEAEKVKKGRSVKSARSVKTVRSAKTKRKLSARKKDSK